MPNAFAFVSLYALSAFLPGHIHTDIKLDGCQMFWAI